MRDKLNDLMSKRPAKSHRGQLRDEYSAFVAGIIGKRVRLRSDYIDPVTHTLVEIPETGELVDHPKKGKREVLYPKGTIMTIERVARDASMMLHTGETVGDGTKVAIWIDGAQVELVD